MRIWPLIIFLLVACGGDSDSSDGGGSTVPELPNPDDLATVELTLLTAETEVKAQDACYTAEAGSVYVPVDGADPVLCLGELVDSTFFRRVNLSTSQVTGDEGGDYYLGLATSADFGDDGYLMVLVRSASSSVGSRCAGVDADGFKFNNVTSKELAGELTGGKGLCGGLDHTGPGAFLLGKADYGKARIVLPGEEKGFDLVLTQVK